MNRRPPFNSTEHVSLATDAFRMIASTPNGNALPVCLSTPTMPKLISDPPPDSLERRAIAKRLCEPDASTAEDDVRLFKYAFRWGDEQWAQWHLDNDSSDDDDEEMGESDPFSDENVPPATKRNARAIRDLFKRRFKKDAPLKPSGFVRISGLTLIEYLRRAVVKNKWP